MQTINTPDERLVCAKKVADDLAFYIFEHPVEWQRPFVLARRLKRFGGEAEEFTDVVRSFCRATVDDFDDFFPQFIDVWHRVKFIDTGKDTFAAAAEEAEREI